MFARTTSRSVLLLVLATSLAFGCGDETRKKRFGDSCGDDTDCASGICVDNSCLDPDGDLDGDGLKNGVEKNLTRTDPARADSDADGVPDLPEVGADVAAPLDRDNDGRIDAIESRLPSADPDGDCIPNEYDSRNDDSDVDPALLVTLGCSTVGVCDAGAASIAASCTDGTIRCDYSAVPDWQADETACDGRDNDCDGQDDEASVTDPTPDDCSTLGVCGPSEVRPTRACLGGAWTCSYAAIPGWQSPEGLCDGLDNDCDGQTDEDLAGGACLNSNDFGDCDGTWTCAQTGGGRVCDGPVPAQETCNGVDDDCDGGTDEDLIGIACKNSSGAFECAGVTVCDGEGGTRCDALVPAPETCNGIDDNCNGATDEDRICVRTAFVKGTIRSLPAGTVAFRPAAPARAAAVTSPLAGAKVRVGSGTACMAVPPVDAFEEVLTAADGSFQVAVVPGEQCVLIEAEGFQTVRTTGFLVAAGESYPIEATLTPTAGATWLGSACGRVTTTPDGGASVPLPGALVTASEYVDDVLVDLASTTADAFGFYCLSGWTILPQAMSSGQILAEKDGHFRLQMPFYPMQNSVMIMNLNLRPIPAQATACLDEDFEASFDGGTDMGVPIGQPWTAEGGLDGAGWQWLADGTLFNPAFDGCIKLPPEEDCSPDTTGCPLCGKIPSPGCLPGPGTVPHAASGTRAWWFGNPRTASYLPSSQSCSDSGKPVAGSVTSPWIPTDGAQDLALAFASAFEVESYDPKTDQLRVEIQTPAMSQTDTWSLVANLKDATAPQGQDPAIGLSTLGVGGSPAWKQFTFDLSTWSGPSIRLRFRFDSVDGNYNAFRGWLVDKVQVTGRGCASGGPPRR